MNFNAQRNTVSTVSNQVYPNQMSYGARSTLLVTPTYVSTFLNYILC